MITLINLSSLQKYDKNRMYEIYDKWPDIAYKYFNEYNKEAGFIGINHIVFAGMGGSGSLGTIFSSILAKMNIHVSVVKGYLLPSTVDSNTLVVATSISGNTIETLTALDTARKMNCKVIGLSSGGKVQEYCKKYNIEHRIIPLLHSPRASFTAFLYSMLKILSPIIPIKQSDVNESITELKRLGESISSNNLSDNNPALDLAKWISGIPVIYYPAGLQAAATRFKNSLNENAKRHALTEDIVEACHNEIVAWEMSSICKPILIEGQDDYIKTKERWKIIKTYFEENNIEFKEVFSIKGNILSKIISLIYLLDYSTIYLAILSKVNPSPIHSIDFVKSLIEKDAYF